jgi:hypothetical protein
MNIESNCGTCVFFNGNKDRHNEDGACVFNPPQVFPIPTRTALGATVLNWQSAPHPAVSAKDICGQWNPRQDVKPALKPTEN